MSRRRNRRRRLGSDRVPPRSDGPVEPAVDWDGVAYLVRPVTGAATTKPYRCPGCDQPIRPGLPHVVAWLADDADAGDRRHWHPPCWRARDRRGARLLRSRRAPRY